MTFLLDWPNQTACARENEGRALGVESQKGASTQH